MSVDDARLGVSGRIARYFVDSELTPLIALVALLAGFFAVLVTPREEEPQIDVTMANVMVPFPGASAKDVESLIATPAEQVLSRMAGVEHVYSVSRPGMAVITVQFRVGEDPTRALVRLHDTVQSHRDWLSPKLGAGEPVVKPMGIDDVPILGLTLWTADPTRAAWDLEPIAHALEVEVKRVPGTRDVQTIGGPGHVVRIVLDVERMHANAVTALDLRGALQVANASQPAGSLVSDNREVLVQTGHFLASAHDIEEIVVAVRNDRPVFVRDVARVVEGPDLPSRYVALTTGPAAAQKGIAGTGSFPAVTLAVSKKPGANAVDVADAVLVRMSALRTSLIPEGVELTVTRNYGETADDKAKKLIRKLAFATASVVVLVGLALGRREAVVVGVAVVLTLAATLFASWAFGFTLNRVSLFALIFSIGILVDDAIVVVENIHRHRALEPGPLVALIPRAVDEVGGPTVLATLAVIAALLPMAFVSGLMGPYMSPIPINASAGMVISLAIAFVVTPWLARRLLAPGAHGAHAGSSEPTRIARFFQALMGPFLDARRGARRRLALYAGILLAIVAAVALVVFQRVVLKMLPFDNKSEFQVVVDLPVGTPLEQTNRVLTDIAAVLAQVPEVTDIQTYAGTAGPINFNGLVRQYYLRRTPETGDLQVNLLDKSHRTRSSHEIAAAVRPEVDRVARAQGARAKVVEVPPGPPVLAPLVVEIYGPDYAGQMQVAARVRAAFAATPDIVDIDDSVDATAPKLALRVLQNKAAMAGVAQRDVVDTVRLGLGGEYVTPIHSGDAKYEVPVRLTLAPERQGSLDDLLKLSVRSAGGALIGLSELTESIAAERDKTIYHKDLLPVVYVVGDMAGRLDSPLYGMFAIRDRIAGVSLDEGGTFAEHFISQPADRYGGYSFKWDGEWQITYETFRDMGIAYAVGLVLIYLLVVAQFRSYLTPLVIMAPIPLTIIGVMPGHALLGAQFTATSMIGMIALAGIIVRNSILLVDFINLRLGQGATPEAAVVEAAAIRAQPIVLTGAAAMLGAFFILDDPIFNGLAVALIFGVLVSTALTLVVIPLLHYSVVRRGLKPALAAAADRAGAD